MIFSITITGGPTDREMGRREWNWFVLRKIGQVSLGLAIGLALAGPFCGATLRRTIGDMLMSTTGALVMGLQFWVSKKGREQRERYEKLREQNEAHT